MPSLPPLDLLTPPTRSDVLRRLTAEVRRRLNAARRALGTTRHVERVEVEAKAVSPLLWLAAQPHAAKVYWHGRGKARATGGVGEADVVVGPAARALDALAVHTEATSARYFGGVRFDPEQRPAPEWAAFEAARFVLPRVEYVVQDGRAVLAVNLVLPRDARDPEPLLADLAKLTRAAEPTGEALPLPVSRTDAPGREVWGWGIRAALEAFEEASLEKVVLARRVRYDFDDPLDPFALARSLEEATPSCFHFLFQPAPGVAFLGASPERLFRREGQVLTSEAVAGTRPRGASDAADARLREELRLSEKDQREHGFVREQIRRALTPFADTLDVETEASDMTLARGRHLYSGIAATLKPDVRSVDLLRALHPTPAVGGTPTAEAMTMIADVEPFDRGWYAGPVGWVGADAAEFAVGIRSGLVESGDAASLSLYSGAGIVRGSEAEAEWGEIEHKIGDFARVLALDA